MKSFDDIEPEKVEPSPVYDKYSIQKQRLLFNVSRSKEVCDALAAWLQSFEGGMSKELFMKQIVKLNFDDDIAVDQINRSKGRRSIAKQKRPTLPPMTDVIQLLANGTLFIAVNGTDKAIKKFVRNTYRTLKDLGKTFVLDLDELRIEWTDKYVFGNSKELLQKAKESEFLIIVGFEVPQELSRWIGDALGTLRRYRIEKNLPIVMPYARYLEEGRVLDNFTCYQVR